MDGEYKRNRLTDQSQDFNITNRYQSQDNRAVIAIKRTSKKHYQHNKLIVILIIYILCFVGQITVNSLKWWYDYHGTWVQLLFVEDYHSYHQYCGQIICNDIILEFQVVGEICFCLMAISVLVTFLEILRMVNQLYYPNSIFNKLKGKITQPIVIILQTICYYGYFLWIWIIQQLKITKFGPAYWSGVGFLAMFSLNSLYYRKLKGSILRDREISRLLKLDERQINYSQSQVTLKPMPKVNSFTEE